MKNDDCDMNELCKVCLAYTSLRYPEPQGKCLLGDDVKTECLANNNKYFEGINGLQDLRLTPNIENKFVVTSIYDLNKMMVEYVDEFSNKNYLDRNKTSLLYSFCKDIIYRLENNESTN